jgi:hypothetical protein
MRLSPARRTVLLALMGCALATSSACFGSFNVTRKVWMFNRDLSKNKFVQEIAFIGMNIIPVYGVAGFIDVIGANLVEFWTGKNPVTMASVRLDGRHVVQSTITGTDGQRTMVIRGLDADSLSWTTTAKFVPNTDYLSFTTVFSNGRTVSRVVGLDAAGNPYLVSNDDKSP